MNRQARTAIFWGVASLSAALVYAGCTQDFGQFEPRSSSTAAGGGSTATATGGGGNGSGATGSGATGGVGECVDSGDCNDDNPCTNDTCPDGECVFTPAPDGALGNEVPTNCVDISCVGGVQTSTPDDTEVPDDSNECTTDMCQDGQAVNMPVAEGTACPAGFCNAAGQCAGCTTNAQCGQDDACKQFVCDNNNVCSTNYTQAGPLPDNDQTDGDCQELQCDGNGNQVSQDDDNDTPPVDGNLCTFEECDNGAPNIGDDPAGTACNVPGPPKVCDGMGTCVECVVEADCDPADMCVNNQCVCTPTTCMALGLTCGSAPNGCGGMLNCNNGIKDGSETDVDCGGSLPGCPVDCGLGKTCNVAQDCVNGPCVDGYCCASACTTVCNACNVPNFLGQCHLVPALTEDAPMCTGTNSCSAAGTCLKDPGQPCAAGAECASGTCTASMCQ